MKLTEIYHYTKHGLSAASLKHGDKLEILRYHGVPDSIWGKAVNCMKTDEPMLAMQILDEYRVEDENTQTFSLHNTASSYTTYTEGGNDE